MMFIDDALLKIGNNNGNSIFEIRDSGIYYQHDNKLIKIKNKEEIVEAFRYCVLQITNKKQDDALFDKYLEKIDNGVLSDKQITEIEKRIRKIKLNKIKLT